MPADPGGFWDAGYRAVGEDWKCPWTPDGISGCVDVGRELDVLVESPSLPRVLGEGWTYEVGLLEPLPQD